MAQDRIDEFLSTLHNSDVRTVLAWVAPDKRADGDTIYAHTIQRILTSINVYNVSTTYPKFAMIQKLVKLLDDPDRDWYANLLLYNLTRSASIDMLSIDTRSQWLETKRNSTVTYKAQDVDMWRKYLSTTSPQVPCE